MTQEVGNETFLEEAIRLAAAEKKELEAAEKCNHGYSPRSYKEHKRCCLFAREYLDALYDDNPNNFVHAVEAAKEKIFPGAWKDEKKLGLTKSKFLHIKVHPTSRTCQQLSACQVEATSQVILPQQRIIDASNHICELQCYIVKSMSVSIPTADKTLA